MDHPPACPAHRALVDEALGPDPSDQVLELYAAEVPSCPACRRSLAVRIGAHPGVLDAPVDPLAGMPALIHAVRAPAPRRRPAVLVGSAAAVLALAAGIAWWMLPVDVEPVSAPVAQLTVPTLAPAPEVVVAPTPTTVVAAPSTVASAPRFAAAPAPALPDNDGVAMADVDDWPPPPFEDLRSGGPKGVAPTVHAAQLVLSGTAEIGHDMALTVVTSSATPLQVCVDGPERGVVWDGAVDAGRTELTRGGRAVSFAFAAPGRYRFSLSTGAADPSRAAGTASCAAPVHVVEVEVRG